MQDDVYITSKTRIAVKNGVIMLRAAVDVHIKKSQTQMDRVVYDHPSLQ